MKFCTKCATEKPFECFSRDKTRIDGLQTYCKTCRSGSSRVYRESNPDYFRTWKLANRGSLNAGARRRRAADPEKYRRQQRSYYWDNVEKKRSERRRIETKRRTRKLELPVEDVVTLDLVARDGAHCWMCGAELSDWDDVHWDHLIPLSMSTTFLGVKNPGSVKANLALACSTCNVKKRDSLMLCAFARYLRNAGGMVV